MTVTLLQFWYRKMYFTRSEMEKAVHTAMRRVTLQQHALDCSANGRRRGGSLFFGAQKMDANMLYICLIARIVYQTSENQH